MKFILMALLALAPGLAFAQSGNAPPRKASLPGELTEAQKAELQKLETEFGDAKARMEKANEEFAPLITSLNADVAKLQAEMDPEMKRMDEEYKAQLKAIKEDPNSYAEVMHGTIFKRAKKEETKVAFDRRRKLLEDFNARKSALSEKLAQATKARDSFQADLDVNKKALERGTARLEGDRERLALIAGAELDYIDETVRWMKADSDFSKIKVADGRLELLLQKMQHKFDNEAMGIYVREKLTAAFQSPQFCKAAKGCQADTPKNGLGNGDLEDLFGGAPENSRRNKKEAPARGRGTDSAQ